MNSYESSPGLRAYLIFVSIAYLGTALASLFWTQETLGLMGIQLTTADSFYELRGSHGGINFAIGIFLMLAVSRNDWQMPALGLLIILNSGYVLGRSTSLLIDGIENPIHLIWLGSEIFLVSFSYYLIRRNIQIDTAKNINTGNNAASMGEKLNTRLT